MAKESLGSLRSQHKRVKNYSCKKSKGASLHHLHLRQHHLRKQLVDAGIREKKIHQYPYQVHNMRFQAQVKKIHQYPNQLQIEKKCDTALQFQAQEREVHQHRYHWTSCRLTCEPAATSQTKWNSAYNAIFALVSWKSR